MYLDSFCAYLGEESPTVDESARRGLLVSDPAHLREVGFLHHRVARDGTTAYDLARGAVEQIRPQLRGIGAIVYHAALPCNANVGSEARYRETRDVRHLADFPASHLQADFALDDAFVVGVSQQACTGLVGAVRLARGLLAAEPELERLLCVTSDRVPPGARYESTYNPLSDGALGCVVSRAPAAFRVLAVHAITNGALSRASADEAVGSYFSYSHRLIQETLARAKLTLDDVHWIVPQNNARAAWQIFCSLLKFDHERVLSPTLPEVGHLVSGCNLLNLMHALERGGIRRGERVLLPTAGYGLNWQCLLVEKE